MLRYIGEISRALPPSIKEILSEPVAGFAPIVLSARGFRIHEVSVDGANQRRVVVDITDTHGDLAKLRASIAHPLEEIGFKPQGPDFDLHVVVGKVSGSGSQTLETVLEEMVDRDFGVCSVRELILYQSDTHALKGAFLRLWHLPFLVSPAEVMAVEPPPREAAPAETAPAEAAPAEASSENVAVSSSVGEDKRESSQEDIVMAEEVVSETIQDEGPENGALEGRSLNHEGLHREET